MKSYYNNASYIIQIWLVNYEVIINNMSWIMWLEYLVNSFGCRARDFFKFTKQNNLAK